MNTTPLELESVWPHRWAVALVCATFPLIWVGGLVTTYDAGMAVPDWPDTYGYNLFLYPWQTWVYGPFGLFIEHGHRLLGSLSGMLTIAFLISAWWCQRRGLVRWLAVVALAAVICQGALGGMRVIEDKVQLAKIHGCVGPAFFAFAVALAVITSRRWQDADGVQNRAGLGKVERLAIVTTFLAYCQLVLGSQLRHLPAGSAPGDFRVALVFHLAIAAALVVHIFLLAFQVFRTQRDEWSLVRPTTGLVALVLVEVGLGAATWVTKYGWPSWMADYLWAADYVVHEGSRLQAWVTTAHVAMGSMILASSLLVALRSVRFAWRGSRAAGQGSWLMEAAR
ncbi:MAG: COX15/CtaA family protein [Planctomycetia bacterium]|nr:COX15/CtaA family protein [Planctomycetia bacterium]